MISCSRTKQELGITLRIQLCSLEFGPDLNVLNAAFRPVYFLPGFPTKPREYDGLLRSSETVITPVEVKSNMAG